MENKRAIISYSVELNELINVVLNLLNNSMQKLNINIKFKEIYNCLNDNNQPIHAALTLNKIEKLRESLFCFDSTLQEISSILIGYQKVLLQEKEEQLANFVNNSEK